MKTDEVPDLLGHQMVDFAFLPASQVDLAVATGIAGTNEHRARVSWEGGDALQDQLSAREMASKLERLPGFFPKLSM